MIDNIVKQLNSPDPAQRKKAIAALAKTKDPSALKYLAAIVKSDSDPEVADLARKAGVYIKKNAPVGAQEQPDWVRQSAVMAADEEESPYPSDDEAEAEDREPLPEEIEVSQADIGRAKGYVEQAINWHMREDNDKAAQYLRRAFATNPKLKYDSYTTGLAATITGLPTDQALRLLSPSPDELKRRVKAKSEGPAASSTHRMLGFVVLAAAVVLLVGYLLFPWVDLSNIPTTTPDGQTMPMGAALAQMKEQIRAFTSLGPTTPEVDRILSAINSLTVSFSGLDTTLMTLGWKNILDAMGAGALLEMFSGTLGVGDLSSVDITVQPQALDYSLLLIPVVGVIVIVLAIMLFTRTDFSARLWGLAILIGLIGLVPLWWFFTSASNEVLGQNTDLGLFGEAGITSGADLIGFGFWVGLVAQLAIIFLPFLALLIPHGGLEQPKE
jgi:hypothetical protein